MQPYPHLKGALFEQSWESSLAQETSAWQGLSQTGGAPWQGVQPKAYCSKAKTVPVLPTVVTQPIRPSDLALHFIRVRPDFSSSLGHSLTSRSSPSLSFLVGSFTFLDTSLSAAESSSKVGVMIVSPC